MLVLPNLSNIVLVAVLKFLIGGSYYLDFQFVVVGCNFLSAELNCELRI